MKTISNMGLTEQEIELLDILNTTWKLLPPVEYEIFNSLVPCIGGNGTKNEFLLLNLETANPKLGIRQIPHPMIKDKTVWGISVLALLATITDYLCGKRLAATIEERDGKSYIVKWSFL